MSSKRARRKAERAGKGRRRAAMTTWLTLYYAIATVVLIAAASARFYFGLEGSMDRAN